MATTQVFLIEDDAEVREITRRLLEHHPRITVVGEASDGEAALESLKELAVDVVTVDLLLPGMSGIETVRKLKEQYPSVKVVVLSAYGGDFMERAVQAGADAYVLKPYAAEQLIERLIAITQS